MRPLGYSPPLMVLTLTSLGGSFHYDTYSSPSTHIPPVPEKPWCSPLCPTINKEASLDSPIGARPGVTAGNRLRTLRGDVLTSTTSTSNIPQLWCSILCPDFSQCIECKCIPRAMSKDEFLRRVENDIAKTIPGYVFNNGQLTALVCELINYMSSFSLNNGTICNYILQIILLKEFVDRKFSQKVFSMCGLGFIASRSLIRSYCASYAPSASRNITYAMKFAGNFLEEKNRSYHFPQFIQFLKEIRRAANRRLKEQTVSHADPAIAMELFKKVKIHLAQANECDVIQDSDLLKFQKLLFLGMILFTTQRANTFVKMSIDDIHCRNGTFMVYLDSGRKRSGRAGKSRYL
ncbi:hypothetical protein ADUPG1_012947, partial [Aduncisulcus paluster]